MPPGEAEDRDMLTTEEATDLLTMISMGISKTIRVQILEAVIEEPMSPVEFHRRYAPDVPLTTVAYNFRQIAKSGYIKCVKKVRRRGSIEHVYEGTGMEFFDDEEWSRVPLAEKQTISALMLQNLFAKVAGAVASGTFNAREDAHLTWNHARSNERGWKRSMEILLTAYTALEDNRVETERELEEADEEGFRVTFALLGFESPDLPGGANGDRSNSGEPS